MEPSVQYTILDLRRIVSEGVLSSEVAIVTPVENRSLCVHQGDLWLGSPVSLTAIHSYLKRQVR